MLTRPSSTLTSPAWIFNSIINHYCYDSCEEFEMSTCIIFLYYVGYDVVILYLFVLNTSSGTMTPDQLIT